MRPFALERYFARYEFSTRYLLCASDPETMPVRELLALEPEARGRLEELRLGYTESRGGAALRTAIAALYEHCDAKSVLAHSGAEEAIFVFMNAVLERGDHAIVQFPAYQSHYSVAEALGAEVTRWHSDLSGEGSPDVDALEALIRPQTRAIVLTTPNNPTGYAFDRAQMERIVAITRKHGIWLLGDEVYRGTEREAERIPAVCDWYERGVSLGGLSKAHGLAGLRIGWSCTRDGALYERMAALKDYLSICNSAPSEFLAEIALRHNATLIARVRDITMRNLECSTRSSHGGLTASIGCAPVPARRPFRDICAAAAKPFAPVRWTRRTCCCCRACCSMPVTSTFALATAARTCPKHSTRLTGLWTRSV